MSELDNAATYARLDPGGMGAYIAGLPDQVADAWHGAKQVALPEAFRTPSQILVFGMGGSAIGGDMLRSLALLESPVPVRVIRGYDSPPRLDERALVVASSNSGGTEETLSAFSQALETPAMPFVSTTGGRLLEVARERGIPHYLYQFPSPPRAALGHGLMPLLRLAEHVGVLSPLESAVIEAVAVMQVLGKRLAVEVPEAENPAKQIARRLGGKLPVVFGSGHLVEAAHRLRSQFAENSKTWAIFDEMPEANHNTIVGLGLPTVTTSAMHGIFFHDPALHPRVQLRNDLTRQALDDAGIASDVIEGHGASPLSALLSAVFFGDYVSYYLAMLNGEDPTPIGPIDRFKARLAQAES